MTNVCSRCHCIPCQCHVVGIANLSAIVSQIGGEPVIPGSLVGPQPCEDHDILDAIATSLDYFDHPDFLPIYREAECLEFQDHRDGRWFEIIVRPIDGSSTENP